MLEALIFLLPPVSVCVILAGIFSYLGLHVLQRGVIFIDIAIAQIAALGTLVGIVAGIGAESSISYFILIAFVSFASLVFSLIKKNSIEVPLEAVIGIVFGLSLAAALFIAEFVPQGADYIKETLTGSLLWVTWGKVALCAVISFVIGAFHYIFREKFIRLSEKNTEVAIDGDKLWDFLFYFTLGLVVVEAVKILGVFLVFTLLVVPAAISLIFFTGWKARVAAAWITGSAASVIGTAAADKFNIPNAPSIVCLLGLLLVLAALVKISFFRKVIP
ncbi:MAG: metal ABC transporter permease [Candidatus Glassbacteria bacterium]